MGGLRHETPGVGEDWGIRGKYRGKWKLFIENVMRKSEKHEEEDKQTDRTRPKSPLTTGIQEDKIRIVL